MKGGVQGGGFEIPSGNRFELGFKSTYCDPFVREGINSVCITELCTTVIDTDCTTLREKETYFPL